MPSVCRNWTGYSHGSVGQQYGASFLGLFMNWSDLRNYGEYVEED